MTFPIYLHLGSFRIHPHWVFETLGYGVGFRVYLWIRARAGDTITDLDRWWVVAAAAVGGVAGSKMLYWLEDPRLTLANWNNLQYLMGGKTIVGALIGALFVVEALKMHLGITARTGDLFTVPLCIGIAIGRIGCFLTGLADHTSGVATGLPWGVDFGGGILRHPVQLYESLFAGMLGIFLWSRSARPHVEGDIFKMFMVTYLLFRICVDFLKPDVRVFAGFSSIQIACVGMLVYYASDIGRLAGISGVRREVNA
jgi:prolipoprotein diacylglyceryltransferase